MASISRRRVLDAVVVAVILAALPSAIHRIVQTGDPYLFTERFFQDVFARLSGPGRLRFIVQPIVAMLLGAGVEYKMPTPVCPRFFGHLLFTERTVVDY